MKRHIIYIFFNHRYLISNDLSVLFFFSIISIFPPTALSPFLPPLLSLFLCVPFSLFFLLNSQFLPYSFFVSPFALDFLLLHYSPLLYSLVSIFSPFLMFSCPSLSIFRTLSFSLPFLLNSLLLPLSPFFHSLTLLSFFPFP